MSSITAYRFDYKTIHDMEVVSVVVLTTPAGMAVTLVSPPLVTNLPSGLAIEYFIHEDVFRNTTFKHEKSKTSLDSIILFAVSMIYLCVFSLCGSFLVLGQSSWSSERLKSPSCCVCYETNGSDDDIE